jgi:hypothetical protein
MVIAKIGFREMQKGKLIIIPNLVYKAETFAVRVALKTLVSKVIKKWQGGLIEKGKTI